ncbi:MAG: dolichyl-phosphate beta-glucosyltransferase [Acidobacteriota bacterium]
MRPELTVVIPAYNEEPRLGASLQTICAHLERGGRPAEILVVDDGSRDRTSAVAEDFAPRGVRVLRQEPNQGKGAAVRRGLRASRGARVLISDADLSTPIEELDRLEQHLAEAPVVLGSRAVAGARLVRRQPFYREAMGKVFNRIVQITAVGGVRDTQCGFKLLDGEVARALAEHLITDGFAYDVELVWLARRFGHRVAEIGVAWENSPSSRVQPLLDPPRMLLEIARFRWHHRRLDARS